MSSRAILALVSILLLIEILHADDVEGEAIPAIIREPLIDRACNSKVYRCADISPKECKLLASESFSVCSINISAVNDVYRDGSESNWDAFVEEVKSLDSCFSEEFAALLEIKNVSADCISAAGGDAVNIEDDGEESDQTESILD